MRKFPVGAISESRMKEIIDATTRNAVVAAMEVIDEFTDGSSDSRVAAAGDPLCNAMDKLIRKALTEHFASDYGPSFVSLP